MQGKITTLLKCSMRLYMQAYSEVRECKRLKSKTAGEKVYIITIKDLEAKKDIRKKEIFTIALVIVLLNIVLKILIFVNYDLTGLDLNENRIQLSNEGGFYGKDIAIKATTSKKQSAIYYTEDGSEPDRETNEHTKFYSEPISLKAEEGLQVTILKFIAYDALGNATEVSTNTYFMEKSVQNRFDTLVISVSTDKDNLYGYENGIFVEGKLRDEYLAENPDAELKYNSPANYNLRGKESEREAHIEVFQSDGTRVITQNGGIRTSGNFTRTSEQKSFKIYARGEYDAKKKFLFPFFTDANNENTGVIATEYDCIKIRNTGNDRLEAFIRDELAMRLGADAGMQDTQYVRPVSVFINGTYQGCYWIHSCYDEEYFKGKYGEYEGNMVVIGSGETEMESDTSDTLVNQYAEEYTQLYDTYSAMDLTVDANYEELSKVIDIDNYLRYFALEILMDNQDWPYNNEKAYRYVDDNPDHYIADTVFDGRYRYLIYDIDTSMGHGYIADNIGADESFERLQKCLDEEYNYAPLFAALMKREDCRQTFITDVCDMMNGALSYGNVNTVLEEMQRERENEMAAYIAESVKNENLTDISDYYIHMQMDCIKAWAKVTPENMRRNIQQLWNLGEQYELNVFLPMNTYACINSVEADFNGFSGIYFKGNEVTIKAKVPSGKKFAYWRVNGTKYYSYTITINEDMIANGKSYVSLYVEDNEAGSLDIRSVCAKGENDYFILRNNTLHDISTKGYYVMDKDKASHIYYLPEMNVKVGEYVRVNCANCLDEEAELLGQVGFSLSAEENLTLCNDKQGKIESVVIPKLALDSGLYYKDDLTGNWIERENETERKKMQLVNPMIYEK